MTPAAATQAVLWSGLLIGLLLGAVAQASRFCTMGALADWFGYGGTGRLMMWVLAVAVAAVGAWGLMQAGWLDAPRAAAWNERFLWLSYPLGGTIFGLGMVLASGCPQRNLVRAGAGNLKALVTLLVAALAVDMTLRGLLAMPRSNWLDAVAVSLGRPQDLASLLAAATGLGADALRGPLVAALVAVAGVVVWRQRQAMEPLHWLGGLGVGALAVAAWATTGHLGFLAEHPETLEPAWLGTYSRRPEGLTFAAPVAHGLQLLTLWSDRNTTATFGVVVTLGVVLGSAASALVRREFRVEGFAGTRDLADHLAGAVLMGFGGVTAMGCSIGQGVSGLSLLSGGAVLAVAGMAVGVKAGLAWQTWRLDRDEA